MKTDGKFIIESGGITQGIQKELGLSVGECKQLGSIWTQIINEFDGENNGQKNMTVTNNRGKNADKSTNYFVYTNAVIEFSKECWQRIVNLVNNALHKNIEIESDSPSIEESCKNNNNEITNSSSDNSRKKLPEIISTPELDNWFLDARTYVIRSTPSGDEVVEIFNPPSQVIKEWQETYEKEHGKMNFPTAVKYLNENPDLPNEIQEYIKKAFGMCDGDVSNNKQGRLGTCHLLSCRDELGDDEELSYIVDNIVKQNNDGTVTVTFFGTDDGNGNPLSYTFTNKEVADSYKYKRSDGTVNSSDPDDAALELGYQKLREYALSMQNQLSEETASISFDINQEYLNLRLDYLENNQDKDEKYTQLYEYLVQNLSDLKKMDEFEMIEKLKQDNMYESYCSCPFGQNIDNLVKLQNEYQEINKSYSYCNNLRVFWDGEDKVQSLGSHMSITFTRILVRCRY